MKGKEMKTAVWILALLLGLSPLLRGAEAEKSPAILLQEALYQEQTEGDLDKAIELYEQVLEQAADKAQLTSKATYHLGLCHQKKGDKSKAIDYFQMVVSEYSDQTAVAQLAVNQLEKLNAPISKSSLPTLDIPGKDIDPAILMPPDTLAYIEIGSPGDQIETILNMLKGTPFENPLAVLGGGSNNGQKNPGDVLGALMNPSMVTEFKKIQGLAVGITEIREDDPSIVAALFPGESDALRGLLLMGLGMVGSPAESLGGMQTLNIENSAAVAYDDHVILIAQPMELLSQAVKQYKGQTDAPSLSSNNKAFSKISRESRQSNIATIWVDPDEVFGRIQKLIPPEHFPEELSVANQFVDFGSLDNFMVQLKLKEDSIAIDATLSLKEGHQCLPYDLIHTPNLTPAGLSAIPENAVLSASFCLGDADSAGAGKVQDQLSRLTGLDIGRELFDNIEQVNLFVVEPENRADVGTHPIGHIALSITSKNPQQTKGLLDQLLSIATLVVKTSAGDLDSIEANPQNGIYAFPVDDDMIVTCYLKQKGNTTLLGLSEPVAAASVRSSADTVNAVTAGALSPVFSDLSPNASKLITGNVGGMLRVADTCVVMMCNNLRNPAHKYIRELSKSFDKTYISVETLEQDNELSVCASLEGIPKLGAVFPQVMRLSECNITDKGCAKGASPANGGCVAPNQTCRLTWQDGLAGVKTHRVYFGTSENDLKLYQETEAADIDGPELDQVDATYYWRVDEIFEDGSVVTGDVWHFGIGTLVGWWKFDEDSGDDANDSSGFGHDATLENMADDCRVAGVDGLALKLDGTDDRVSIPALNLNSNTVTITAWIKRDGPQESDDAGIVFCRDGGTVAGLCFYHDTMNLGYNWNDDQRTWGWNSELFVPDNKWFLVSLVVDPTQATLYLGEDGALKSASQKLHHGPAGFNGKTYIGHDTEQYVGGRHFKGSIDDVRFYNYSLSESEIQQILDLGHPGDAS